MKVIHYRNNRVYDSLAFCIMPNHLHLVFALVGRVADPTKAGRDNVPSYIVTNIFSSLKKYTALRANRLLHRRGSFWQDESYDHVIRDDELERVVWYVLSNPEKAGLVQSFMGGLALALFQTRTD
jgi:REP element-mobilizing transposase RayT